jgi:hypothetical protein
MAKKKGGTNKSQAIRDVLAAHPERPVKEIVADLAPQGVKVTPNLVYFIKGKLKGGKKRKKRIARVAMQAVKASANGRAKKTDAIAMIRGVKELAEMAGRYDELKKAHPRPGRMSREVT